MCCGQPMASVSMKRPPRRCARIDPMAMTEPPHVDKISGQTTTGHEWDGIRELNTPLPRWWLYIFYATIVFAVLYWIAYPAWPLVSSYTTGVLGYTNRGQVAQDL